MRRVLTAVLAAIGISACSDRPTEPRSPLPRSRPTLTTDPADAGPPPPRSFGPDSYSTGVFTGAGSATPGA